MDKKLDPKKTIIAVDLHGVLFTANHKEMFRIFWQSKNKLKLFRALLSPALWLDFFSLLKKNAVAEEYIVRLADNHYHLKPFVPLGIEIANTQEPNEHVIAMLWQLKKNGCTLYLFSNIGNIILTSLISKHPKVFTLFDGSTVAAQENNYRRKPNAAAFQAFLKAYNPDNKAVILLDDKRKNIRGANENGLIGVFFKSPEQAASRLRDLGVL